MELKLTEKAVIFPRVVKCIKIAERLDPIAPWALPLGVIPCSLLAFLILYATSHLDQALHDTE